MADYVSTTNSIIGSDYVGGLVSGFEDYMVIPISSNKTIVLQGEFSSNTSADGVINFEGERWIIDRGDGYNAVYNADYTPSVTCSVEITNPYYCRGSLEDMSIIDSRRDDVASNFSIISIMWGVLICVVLWDLLRSSVRSRY